MTVSSTAVTQVGAKVVRKSRNPINLIAGIAATVTSVFCGLVLAATANWIAYGVHRLPPDAAEAQQILGGALPGIPFTVSHVPTGRFEIYQEPVTWDRLAADPDEYDFAYTRGSWTGGSLSRVAEHLAATGWTVSDPIWDYGWAYVATQDDTLVLLHDSEAGISASLRRDPPEAVGAAVVFGLGGVVLTWLAIASLRRRMDVNRVPGSLSIAAYTFGVLISMMVLALDLVLIGAYPRYRPETSGLGFWNVVGLPWLIPGYVVPLLLFLVAAGLALLSTRPRKKARTELGAAVRAGEGLLQQQQERVPN